MLRLSIALLLITLSGCASYEYRPFVDSVDACFSNKTEGREKIDTECYSQPAFVDLDKIHEMSPTENRYLPTPSD